MSSLADIDYAERGEGPALLMVPGSFGTGAAWKAVIGHLGAGFRTITTSLQGYGGTRDRRAAGSPTMVEQLEIFDALLGHIDAPVHVVAHSYGALSALAHALHGRQRAASLTLFEANPYTILRAPGEETSLALFTATTRAYLADVHAGRRDAARHVIDFYEGPGSFDVLPEKVRDYVIETTPTNVLDWASAATFVPALGDFGAIRIPTLLARGGNGNAAMLRIGDLLASHIPGARLETVPGGSHMLPATHPAECAALIAETVARATE